MSRIRRLLVASTATVALAAAGAVLAPAAVAAAAPSQFAPVPGGSIALGQFAPVPGGGLAPSQARRAQVPCPTTGTAYQWVVLHTPYTPEARVEQELATHCATKTTYYREIGVSIATSVATDFAQRIGVDRAYSGQLETAEPAVAGTSGTARLRAQAREQARADREVEDTEAAVPAVALADKQWDMQAIKADQANAIDPGKASVTVGVLDSGIESTHPAFARSLDRAASVGCLTGAADRTPASWDITTSDHGTHVAGTIAGQDAAADFTGVAPGVKVASVKVVNDDGFIFPEAAVCGFMWSGAQQFEVTNNSYYVDPGMFYCPDKPQDKAAYESVRRAVRWSQQRGVLNIAAAGNSNFDVTAQTVDPNSGEPLSPNCGIVPKVYDEVVTVSATGYNNTKATYSSWGDIDVTAPGGDRVTAQPVPGQPSGCILSAIVGNRYGYKCGTSMASPHAAGVAALAAGVQRTQSPQLLRRTLEGEADGVACASTDTSCTGSVEKNNYYGNGMVDALDAIR